MSMGEKSMSMGVRSVVLASASIAAAACSLDVSAAVLVKYPFDNNADGSSGFAYSTFDSGVLASSTVAAGAGLGQFSVGTDSWSGSVQVLKTGPGTAVSGATAATALANDWYFEFTLTPTSSMDIRSIEADWSRGGTTATRGWFVRSSLDGYASDLFANETPVGTSFGLQHAGFNISGFTGLTSAVTFRFYIYTDATGRYMDFQNVQFNSHALAVPGAGLAGFATVGLAGASRRRRR
ncbi:MAG: hypothetical protein ACO3NL_05030 [Phycisphaerales bacterium]